MYKTLGGYNWSDLFISITSNSTEKCAAPPMLSILDTPVLDADFNTFSDDQQFATLDKGILESAKELQLSFHGLKAVSIQIKCDFESFALSVSNWELFSSWNRYLRPMCIAVYLVLQHGGHVSYGLRLHH